MRAPSRLLAAALLAVAGLGGIALIEVARTPVPSFTAVRAAHRPSDVPLLDRHGAVVHEIRTDPRERRRAWSALADVSPALTHAIVAAEDRRFASHPGVDPFAVAGAAWARLAGGPARGASTITMQLAALVDPARAPRVDRTRAPRVDGTDGTRANGRTVAQKLRQMRAALALERAWSKDEILEAYLNRVVFRGELRGVGAAAAFLYGKEPHGLDAAESAVLAALVKNPNASAEAVRRRARALAGVDGHDHAGADRDVDAVAGHHADGIVAAAARLDAPNARTGHADLAPHLARRLLQGRLAPVLTTLDAGVQRVARDALRRALLSLAERKVEDGAVLVVDNASGDVLAYVGGSGSLSRARFVDTVRARRQPGSTLKPFLYGLAFERRLLTPASLVEDTPLAVAVAGGLYRPRDYDQQFRGLVSARTALASSLNVPAVRTLGLVGGDAFVELLRALHIAAATEDGDYYGPALALGGVDVTLWELVGAYRALANGGTWSPLRVTAEDRPRESARRIFSPATAFQVTDVLADRDSRAATFGLESALATRFFTAVKTGTSKEMRDNWCLGFSERYTVGVWVGNASGAPMHDVSGITGAAPVWLDVMNRLHQSTPSRAPEPPPDLVAATVTEPSAAAGAAPIATEPARREWFAPGTAPVMRRLATGDPRIIAPVDGTIVALDPDIPPDRQRVALEAAGTTPGLRWRIDDADLGPAESLALWEPAAGVHTVRLVDAEEREQAVARVEVRGGRGRRDEQLATSAIDER